MEASRGHILQIQNYSVNDGDGIRTVLFFAGCPLRCAWCANPEGYTMKNRIFYSAPDCLGCSACTNICPLKIDNNLNSQEKRAVCTGCGKCTTVCPAEARKNTVSDYTVQEILSVLEKQLVFFRNSGGGVTYSGGECTMQLDFLNELADKVYDRGIPQAMETSGFFDFNEVRHVIDLMDLIFIDIKHMDSRIHLRYTGVPNDRILDTISRLGAEKNNIVIRVPVIMGVNGDDENIVRTAAFVKHMVREPKMELLPYHHLGDEKYIRLGYPLPSAGFCTPTPEELERLRRLAEREGVTTVTYR
jgi:pyruvate formate lyase activating enzyme